MNPTYIALLAGLLPISAANIAYLVSAYSELTPWCFNYVEGCVSVSRGARHGEALHIFRALMLPATTIIAVFWLSAFAWLKSLKDEVTGGMNSMRILGVVGALFLILYAVYLGTEGKTYRFMRQYGVIIYFSFTALAQIFLIRRLLQLRNINSVYFRILGRIPTLMLILCVLQWGSGLASVSLEFLNISESTKDRFENIFEWNFGLIMNLFFITTAFAFKRTDFHSTYQVRQR